jgi:serine/threonine protein kinase
MSAERFRQIAELYHAAREGTAGERAALLEQADPALRREVESLLAQPDSGELPDRPVIENLPELLEDATVTGLAWGACLGPYRIESKLGEGGMGEVFRAIDTRLGRAVAIKLTRKQFSTRFEREARAISSLNNTKSCTLPTLGLPGDGTGGGRDAGGAAEVRTASPGQLSHGTSPAQSGRHMARASFIAISSPATS